MRLKERVALAIGWPICALPPFARYKAHLLSTWQQANRRSALDALLFPHVLASWFARDYLPEPDPDRREALKAALMGGGAGAAWAAAYDAHPLDFAAPLGNMTLGEASPTLPRLDAWLATQAAPVLVAQIGASSGRELAWLAGRHPAHEYLGTDIYPEVVAYAQAAHPAVRFVVCAAKDIPTLLAPHKGRPIVVLSSGSLQYVQPEHLRDLFRALGRMPQLSLWLSEPASSRDGPPGGLGGSRWRDNFSYTHDYRWYAAQAGFSARYCAVAQPYPGGNTVQYNYEAGTHATPAH